MQVMFRFMEKNHSVKKEQTCTISEQVPLSCLLKEQGISLHFLCGGNGTCGKCKVRFLEGADTPTAGERRFFTTEELDAGYRLACCTTIVSDCVIEIPRQRETIQGIRMTETKSEDAKGNKEYGIAIDLGTTTIAYALVDLSNGDIEKTLTEENPQREYGADVMSRMRFSNDGGLKQLQQCILAPLQQRVKTLCDAMNGSVQKVVIAGNTTMCHLLMGYSCERLAVAPFVPISVEQCEIEIANIPAVLLPGISAFIGGDIVAGLVALDFTKDDTPKFLLDLGTNGEMVLWTGKEFLATSASAGPAFEGGNITCGCASVPGAVCNVIIAGAKSKVTTIGGVPAVGICGSGLLAAMSGLLRNKQMDENGILQGEYLEKGYELYTPKSEGRIVITQEDIQNFQMAKSAIATGIECLLHHAGLQEKDVMNVFLAGGFGVHLQVDAAADIGLLPREWRANCASVGNTSLQGAVQYLLQPEQTKKRMEFMRSHVSVCSLNEWEQFQDRFIENLRMSRR